MKRHTLSNNPHPDDLKLVVEAFKALSDATRARLVLLLTQHEHSVGELVAVLQQPQSTVSRHLGILRGADLVATQRRGTSVYYRLSDTHLGELVRQAFAHAQHKRMGLADHPDIDEAYLGRP